MPRRGAVVSIAGIGKREPGSVRDAVPAHVDELYRFALCLTHNADRARDIVHESTTAWYAILRLGSSKSSTGPLSATVEKTSDVGRRMRFPGATG